MTLQRHSSAAAVLVADSNTGSLASVSRRTSSEAGQALALGNERPPGQQPLRRLGPGRRQECRSAGRIRSEHCAGEPGPSQACGAGRDPRSPGRGQRDSARGQRDSGRDPRNSGRDQRSYSRRSLKSASERVAEFFDTHGTTVSDVQVAETTARVQERRKQQRELQAQEDQAKLEQQAQRLAERRAKAQQTRSRFETKLRGDVDNAAAQEAAAQLDEVAAVRDVMMVRSALSKWARLVEVVLVRISESQVDQVRRMMLWSMPRPPKRASAWRRARDAAMDQRALMPDLEEDRAIDQRALLVPDFEEEQEDSAASAVPSAVPSGITVQSTLPGCMMEETTRDDDVLNRLLGKSGSPKSPTKSPTKSPSAPQLQVLTAAEDDEARMRRLIREAQAQVSQVDRHRSLRLDPLTATQEQKFLDTQLDRSPGLKEKDDDAMRRLLCPQSPQSPQSPFHRPASAALKREARGGILGLPSSPLGGGLQPPPPGGAPLGAQLQHVAEPQSGLPAGRSFDFGETNPGGLRGSRPSMAQRDDALLDRMLGSAKPAAQEKGGVQRPRVDTEMVDELMRSQSPHKVDTPTRKPGSRSSSSCAQQGVQPRLDSPARLQSRVDSPARIGAHGFQGEDLRPGSREKTSNARPVSALPVRQGPAPQFGVASSPLPVFGSPSIPTVKDDALKGYGSIAGQHLHHPKILQLASPKGFGSPLAAAAPAAPAPALASGSALPVFGGGAMHEEEKVKGYYDKTGEERYYGTSSSSSRRLPWGEVVMMKERQRETSHEVSGGLPVFGSPDVVAAPQERHYSTSSSSSSGLPWGEAAGTSWGEVVMMKERQRVSSHEVVTTPERKESTRSDEVILVDELMHANT